jgi:hypothetical protein
MIPLVQDDKPVSERGRQELGQLVLLLSLDQFVNQASGVVKAHAMALPTGGQAKTGGHMRFPQTWVADHEERLGFLEIAPARQFQDALLVQAEHTGEIKGGFDVPLGTWYNGMVV